MSSRSDIREREYPTLAEMRAALNARGLPVDHLEATVRRLAGYRVSLDKVMLKFPETKEIKYQAIAESNDWTVRQGWRGAGEPLFAELKSLEFLQGVKKTLTAASWESLYQQNPIIAGGGVIPLDREKSTKLRP